MIASKAATWYTHQAGWYLGASWSGWCCRDADKHGYLSYFITDTNAGGFVYTGAGVWLPAVVGGGRESRGKIQTLMPRI